jgi:hypothetical protein
MTIPPDVLTTMTNPPGAAPVIDTRIGTKNANTLCPVALTGLTVPPKKDHPLALPSLLRSNGMIIFLTKSSNNPSPFNNAG